MLLGDISLCGLVASLSSRFRPWGGCLFLVCLLFWVADRVFGLLGQNFCLCDFVPQHVGLRHRIADCEQQGLALDPFGYLDTRSVRLFLVGVLQLQFERASRARALRVRAVWLAARPVCCSIGWMCLSFLRTRSETKARPTTLLRLIPRKSRYCARLSAIWRLSSRVATLTPRCRSSSTTCATGSGWRGAVTLPCEERERTTPYGFSSRRDGLTPCAHRRSAEHAV